MAEGLAKQQALIRAAQLGGGDKAQTKWIMDVPLEERLCAIKRRGCAKPDAMRKATTEAFGHHAL